MNEVDSEINEKEAQYIDITNEMFRSIEELQDRYDMYTTRTLISNICELLMSQGMTRDEAWNFVNEAWYA